MERLSRRRFLEDSVAALAAACAASAASAERPVIERGRKLGPNDRIRIAVIGFGGRGMNHIEEYAKMKDVEIAMLCDADSAMFAQAIKTIEKEGKTAPPTCQDMRKVFDDKTIDAVSIATPNHWHSLAAIWAIQSGKDVYVEKPVSHNVSEGRRIVEAARKYNKICQTGTQCRSTLIEPMAYLHEGKLGKISVARGLCYKRRKSIGKTEGNQPVPSTVDYNMWLGPAPMVQPHRSRFHYDWHWFWDYGAGDLGNQGIHQMDIARWGLGKHGFPKHVIGLGGRFGYVDDGETPNTHLAFMDYGDSQLIFETRGLETDPLKTVMVGNIFYGSEGVMVVPGYNSAIVFDNSGNKVKEFKENRDHFRNFLDAMRSRKVSDLAADIEEGHVSSALCHLGNISYRLGETAPFHSEAKTFGDNKEAYETFGRYEQHLAANGVQLVNGVYKLGRALECDARKESFRDDPEANAMLTRTYRQPFVVPKKV